mgnify:CR=1 FL=1
MEFMANMIACCGHSSMFYDALRLHVAELPEKGEQHYAFRVPVGGGYVVSVSFSPDVNPGGTCEVVETLVFDPNGQSIYDLPEELGYDDDVQRFYVGEGDHVIKVAAHIKALRDHFGFIGAGSAAAAPPDPEESEQGEASN